MTNHSISTTRTVRVAILAAASVAAFNCSEALAQSPRQTSAYAPEEIIVTARKRQESIMKAPLLIQAMSAQQIVNLKISNFEDLSSVTPSLKIAPAFGTVGAYVYLRGLGNGGAANLADQSVQLNVDGVAMTHGTFYRTGMFDINQIEIMKGPQSLFFGRSSSAGIIAVHSANPTDVWESSISVGYEFDADEAATEGYVSGPITDKLAIRLAGYYSNMKGWLLNVRPDAAGRRLPKKEEVGGRITLEYDDRDIGLRVNLKYAKGHIKSDMSQGDVGQRVCGGGRTVPLNGGYPFDNCIADRVTQSPGFLPAYDPTVDWFNSFGNAAAFAAGSPLPLAKNGHPYLLTDTNLVTLNVDYDVSPGLTLTSVSAYSVLRVVDSVTATTPLAPGFFADFHLTGEFNQLDYSQELRLTSDWEDSWINFIVGGLYSSSQAKNHTSVAFPALTWIFGPAAKLNTEVFSTFGQVILTPIDQFELAAGVRYTSIKKTTASLIYAASQSFTTFAGPFSDNVTSILPPAGARKKEKNWSPEVTLSWKPTDVVTAFISYKEGYKGPGLNVGFFDAEYTPGVVDYFDGETAKGIEGGVKASLFDRTLNITAAAYTYKYSNMQVSFALGGTFTTITRNAASARVKGLEFEADYHPPSIDGLTLNGALYFNDSKFNTFPGAACYSNQSAASGCVNGNQDFGGRRLANAPKFTATFGFTYRHDFDADYAASLNLRGNYSSGFSTIEQQNPTGYQSGYAMLDASLRVGKLEGPWEVAVIVRNLTNKIAKSAGFDDAGAGPEPGDVLAYIHRPRQLMLRLTVRPEIF